jgi:hypothetical protein
MIQFNIKKMYLKYDLGKPSGIKQLLPYDLGERYILQTDAHRYEYSFIWLVWSKQQHNRCCIDYGYKISKI